MFNIAYYSSPEILIFQAKCFTMFLLSINLRSYILAGASIVGMSMWRQSSHPAGEGLQEVPPGPAHSRGVEYMASVCCWWGAQALPTNREFHQSCTAVSPKMVVLQVSLCPSWSVFMSTLYLVAREHFISHGFLCFQRSMQIIYFTDLTKLLKKQCSKCYFLFVSYFEHFMSF